MSKIAYKTLFCMWYIISLLPLRILYVISDIIYFMVYYVVRYRRKIVRSNLTTSFPEKTEAEIINIEKQFYSFFCDYIVETIKLMSISKEEIKRRMCFENYEILNEHAKKNEPCSIYLGHFGNWEWISSLALWIESSCKAAQVYHVLENKVMNELFLYVRNRFGAVSITMEDTYRTLLTWKREKQPHIVGYISDQAPGYNVHYWTDFLNHDTPVYTGAEKISRVTNAKVYYADVERIKRGYYKVSFVEITQNIAERPTFSITEEYFRRLENSIQKNPHLWLWAHNRWKRTREIFNIIHNEEERKRLLSRL